MLKEFEELLLDTHYLKCKIKPWETETPSGKNGGKLFKSSGRNIFKKVWN
jgi:hypothetical protein